MMILSSLALLAFAGPRSPAPFIAGMHLVFDQEFAHMKTLDPSVWIWNDGPVYNHEQEKYTNQAAANAYLQHGDLVIEARKEGNQVTSARLESKGSWKYGYLEVRAKVPPGRGTWPAVWLLNQHIKDTGATKIAWPKCGEIDLMENVGYEPNKFHFSLHSQDFNFMQKNQRTKAVPCPDPFTYHTFGLDWQPNKIVFRLDGKDAYEVDRTSDSFDNWPFKDPFFIIVNLAIGGDWGGSKGVDPAIFPAKFDISYIRFYQKN